MATNQETPTLEETLNRTDLGHIINENKKPIMIAAAIIVLAIIGYSISDHMRSESRLAKLDKVFDLEKSLFQGYLTDKVKDQEFISGVVTIENDLVGHPNLVPVFIDAINKLDENSAVNAEIISTTEKWAKHVSKSSFLHLFLSVRLSALYEDAGNLDMAISTLESLVANKSKILKNKIYFDLGRLYLAKGDKGTAQERLNALLGEDSVKGTEFETMANILLSEI